MSSSRLVGRLRVIMGLDDARFQKGLGDAATGMRDNWSVMSRTGQPLYRHALPFQFEVS